VLQVESASTRVKRQNGEDQRESYLQRAYEGDPERSWRRGSRTSSPRSRKDQEAKLSKAREKPPRAEEAAADVRRCRGSHRFVRNYLDWLLSIPWKQEDKVKSSQAAQEISTRSTSAGEGQERIVEYLAVHSAPTADRPDPAWSARPASANLVGSRSPSDRPCFVRCRSRVRVRGGLRAHRRTYIGSMPGKVIQSMRRQVVEPLFLLDEVGQDGADPRRSVSALLSARPRAEPHLQRPLLESTTSLHVISSRGEHAHIRRLMTDGDHPHRGTPRTEGRDRAQH